MEQSYLKSILHYNPETGLFTRLVRKGNHKIGSVAGTLANGYIQIRIDNVGYLGHRLAWLYMKGTLPDFQVDHRDLIRSNNKWFNLREATSGQNHQNRTKNKNNKSGYLGASLEKKTGKYLAFIKLNRMNHYLGSFSTAKEAHEAYKLAKLDLHKFNPVPTIRQEESVVSAVGNSR
jgi:hypothetical protein